MWRLPYSDHQSNFDDTEVHSDPEKFLTPKIHLLANKTDKGSSKKMFFFRNDSLYRLFVVETQPWNLSQKSQIYLGSGKENLRINTKNNTQSVKFAEFRLK